MVIDVGHSENFVASDIYAILQYTKQIIYPENYRIVSLTSESVDPFNAELTSIDYNVETVELYTEVSAE